MKLLVFLAVAGCAGLSAFLSKCAALCWMADGERPTPRVQALDGWSLFFCALAGLVAVLDCGFGS